MRIAYIAPTFGHAFGQERSVCDSILLLQQAGHSVFPIEDARAMALHTLSFPGKVRALTASLLSQLESAKPQVVHFAEQMDFRIMRAVSHRYPAILTAHTVAPTCPASHRLIRRSEICTQKSGIACLLHHHRYGCLGHFRNDLHRLNAVQNYLVKRSALKHFRAIIAISKYVEQTLLADGFRRDQVFQIYNAVQVTEGKAFPHAPKNLIVTASRLVELKGIPFTLHALKKIEQESWTYWILGDGPARKTLEELVRDLDLTHKVKFMGQTTREHTEEIFRAAVLVTQTNVGPEGFGLSVAEAQAFGKPVIAFDVPALNELIIHGETGYLIPPRDTEALARSISSLVQDPAMRLYMGSQAREHMNRMFSAKEHLRKTVELYKVCLDRSLSAKVNEDKTVSISFS